VLAHEVAAEAAVRLLAVQGEPGVDVEPPGCIEHVVGPQRDPLVARARRGVAHALPRQGPPDLHR
jgi:hypothetical protein